MGVKLFTEYAKITDKPLKIKNRVYAGLIRKTKTQKKNMGAYSPNQNAGAPRELRDEYITAIKPYNSRINEGQNGYVRNILKGEI